MSFLTDCKTDKNEIDDIITIQTGKLEKIFVGEICE
jgi:hypothetical protein